jgi:hypothetical protein
MRLGALILVALAGCTSTPQEREPSLIAGVTDDARCPADIPEGTWYCTASSAAVGNRDECCGGALPTRSCASGLECRTPVPGGVGICLSPDWRKGEPASVCISEPAECVLPIADVPKVPVPTICDAFTRCGGASYRLECDGASCFCYVDGVKSGPFPAGDICAKPEATAAAIGSMCGAPEEATKVWLK